MEIPDMLMSLVAFVFVSGISIVLLKSHYEKKLRSDGIEQGSTGVKKRAQKGQEDAVETLKDLTAESIKFLKDTNNELRGEVKRLKSSVSWYKSQMYGDGRVDEHDSQGTPNPMIKVPKGSDVSEDVLNMRMKMIADKLKMPQELLMFEDVKNVIAEIAGSPQFDEIAAAAMRNSGKTPESNIDTQNVRYV